MAEAIAVVASAIALMQLTDRIVQACRYFIQASQGMSSDLRRVMLEISSLKALLENLRFLAETEGGKHLALEHGLLDNCENKVLELEKLFPTNVLNDTATNGGKKNERMKLAMQALNWPRKAEKARKLLEEISHHKGNIQLLLLTESTQDIKDIKANTSGIYLKVTDAERREVCRWLQCTDPSSIHNLALEQYEQETGNWVRHLPEWSNWLSSKHRCLWIHGIPGAGKTMLMAHIFRQTAEDSAAASKTNVAHVFYYCHYTHNQDETAPFLRWILTKLCQKAKIITPNCLKMFQEGSEPSLQDLRNSLKEILAHFKTVYVFIDALDESSQPWTTLLDTLQCLATDADFDNLQLLAASREYPGIQAIMEKVSKPVSMSNKFVQRDIKRYVAAKIHTNSIFERWPEDLLQEVEKTLSERAEGMFRWAVCQLDILKRLNPTPNVVQQELKNLPKTINETYRRIILMVPEDGRPLVFYCLRWFTFVRSSSPGHGISMEALHCLATESTVRIHDPTFTRQYNAESLREMCGCLISDTGKESGIELAHYTVHEYLRSLEIHNEIESVNQPFISIMHHFLDVLLDVKRFSNRNSEVKMLHQRLVIGALNRLRIDSSRCEIWWTGLKGFMDPTIPEGFFANRVYESAQTITNLHHPPVTNAALFLAAFHLSALVGNQVFILHFLEQTDLKEIWTATFETRGKSQTNFSFDVPAFLLHQNFNKMKINDIFLEVLRDVCEETQLLLILLKIFRLSSNIDSTERYVLRCLDNGADPNATGYGVTPLQLAVDGTPEKVIERILQAGADPNLVPKKSDQNWPDTWISDPWGKIVYQRPLSICRDRIRIQRTGRTYRKDYRTIEEILIRYGARMGPDDDGKSHARY